MRNIDVFLVPCSVESLNTTDAFLLDLGKTVYHWNSKGAGIFEKQKASAVLRGLDDEKDGAETIVIEQGDSDSDAKAFFSQLGSSPDTPISDEIKHEPVAPQVWKVSDASGSMSFEKVGEGYNIDSKVLDTNDVIIIDVGFEIFVWEGRKANKEEKNYGNTTAAKDYLKNHLQGRPSSIQVSRCMEGGENEVIKHFLK